MTAPQQDDIRSLLRQPIPLASNRVYRFYTGGLLMDRLKGAAEPRDTEYPEDWVGSITAASNPGHPPEEGLSRVALPSGEEMTLRDLLEAYPEEALGREHVAKYGRSTGLLVKLLDSSVRLPIHCHPSRAFARQYLGSIFGKTEAWMVLETRQIAGTEPYVMLGFKEGVEKDTFRRQVDRQEIKDMKAGLHKVPVKAGDVFYVKAGLPHAIGPGVFMIEAQEPTDYLVLAEWEGYPIEPEDTHMGLGWDVAVECYDFTNYSPEKLLQEYKLEPEVLRKDWGGEEVQLLGGKTAEYFGATRLTAHGEMRVEGAGFYTGIVTSGNGVLTGEWGEIRVRQGDSFVCSAAVPSHSFRADGDAPLEVIRCLPPV